MPDPEQPTPPAASPPPLKFPDDPPDRGPVFEFLRQPMFPALAAVAVASALVCSVVVGFMVRPPRGLEVRCPSDHSPAFPVHFADQQRAAKGGRIETYQVIYLVCRNGHVLVVESSNPPR